MVKHDNCITMVLDLETYVFAIKIPKLWLKCFITKIDSFSNIRIQIFTFIVSARGELK